MVDNPITPIDSGDRLVQGVFYDLIVGGVELSQEVWGRKSPGGPRAEPHWGSGAKPTEAEI